MFANANIGARDPFKICLRKSREGGRYYEVKKLSDAQEPALDPRRYPDEQGNVTPFDALPTAMERKLEASIAEVQQRKALPFKVAPSAAPQSGAMTAPPRQANSTPPAGGTHASNVSHPAEVSAEMLAFLRDLDRS